MKAQIKVSGAYANAVGIFEKSVGTYKPAEVFVKVAGVYTSIISINVLQILAKYGTDAHLWLPGVGVVNGITANNWIDSVNTQAAIVDSPVGSVNDVGGGSVTVAQTVDANRPMLRLDVNGKYYWEFNGVSQHLRLSSPVFQMSDDFCVVAGVSLTASGFEKSIFAQSNASNHALPEFMFNASGRLGVYAFGGGATVSAFNGPINTGAGVIVATMLKRSSTIVARRNGVDVTNITVSGSYAQATTAAIGAYPVLNNTEFLTGSIYPVIAIKGTVSDEDMSILESWNGSASGILV